MSKKEKQSSASVQNDDAVIFHLSAMIHAADYIDKCLRAIPNPGPNEPVPFSILLNEKLSPLDTHPSTINEMQKELKKKLKDYEQDVPIVMQTPIEPGKAYDNIFMNAASEILKQAISLNLNIKWFLPRVEKSAAPSYYERIPFGMFLGLICARFYKTKCENPDLTFGDGQVNLFYEWHPEDFGSLNNPEINFSKKIGQLSNEKTVEGMGEILCMNTQQPPKPYSNFLEFMRDMLEIGVNCLYFNQSVTEFVKLSHDYINDVLNHCKQLLPDEPLPIWAEQAGSDKQIIDIEMKEKKNGYSQLNSNFLIEEEGLDELYEQVNAKLSKFTSKDINSLTTEEKEIKQELSLFDLSNLENMNCQVLESIDEIFE